MEVIKIASNEICPKGGLYKISGSKEKLTVNKGDSMPTYKGRIVYWELVQSTVQS